MRENLVILAVDVIFLSVLGFLEAPTIVVIAVFPVLALLVLNIVKTVTGDFEANGQTLYNGSRPLSVEGAFDTVYLLVGLLVVNLLINQYASTNDLVLTRWNLALSIGCGIILLVELLSAIGLVVRALWILKKSPKAEAQTQS